MSKEISQRAFARTAGVSAAAIRHALAAGRLVEDDNGMDLEEGTNALFLEEHQQQAVERMEEAGELLPGWACMAVPFPGRAPCPVFFLPPYGETSFPASDDSFDGWTFDAEVWTATDPAGKRHKLVLVTCKDRPPWLEKAQRARKSATRPRARGRVISRGGRARADCATAHHAQDKGAKARQ